MKIKRVVGSAIVSDDDLVEDAKRNELWIYHDYSGSYCPCNGC